LTGGDEPSFFLTGGDEPFGTSDARMQAGTKAPDAEASQQRFGIIGKQGPPVPFPERLASLLSWAASHDGRPRLRLTCKQPRPGRLPSFCFHFRFSSFA
jgi:hypothetical protein